MIIMWSEADPKSAYSSVKNEKNESKKRAVIALKTFFTSGVKEMYKRQEASRKVGTPREPAHCVPRVTLSECNEERKGVKALRAQSDEIFR